MKGSPSREETGLEDQFRSFNSTVHGRLFLKELLEEAKWWFQQDHSSSLLKTLRAARTAISTPVKPQPVTQQYQNEIAMNEVTLTNTNLLGYCAWSGKRYQRIDSKSERSVFSRRDPRDWGGHDE